MVNTLLGLLTANAHKTPDEIVRVLNHKGWIKGSEIPRSLAQEWHDTRKMVAICYGCSDGSFGFSGTDYSMSSFPPDYVYQNLPDHWFMLQSEFNQGVTLYPNGGLI